MNTLVMFGLTVVACAALAEGRWGVPAKREAAQAGEHPGKLNVAETKPDGKELLNKAGDKHEDSKERDPKEADEDIVAVIAIFMDPETRQPRVVAQDLADHDHARLLL